jgi:hypothetical protein
MMLDVLETNRDEALKALERCRLEIEALEGQLSASQFQELGENLERARSRQSLLLDSTATGDA